MGTEAEVPPTENTDDDMDGCDCSVEEAGETLDEDLPAAVGGVD